MVDSDLMIDFEQLNAGKRLRTEDDMFLYYK
jgi:hypothetical protein